MQTGGGDVRGQQKVPSGAKEGPVGAEGGQSGPQAPAERSFRAGALDEAYPPSERFAGPATNRSFSAFPSKVNRNRNLVGDSIN